ncbi:MAG: MXAN_6640 family putative metalloprotease [Marmoricola sp.]
MPRLLRGPLVAALALVMAAVLPLQAEAAPSPGPAQPKPHFTRAEAKDVLAEAKSQFRKQTPGNAARSLAGHTPDTDITLTLRDLSRARTALTGEDLREANNLLARPTNAAPGDAVKYGGTRPFRSWCPAGSPVCVHWVTSGVHAISLLDSDRDGIPNYVEYVHTTMQYVYNYEVRTMGYRAPRSDSATAGKYRGNPNGKYDVYLAELGDVGLYGYCAPEGSASVHQLPGYCVLDNNYARSQYGSANILDPMRVTAAHEFFHAIQFAYDVDEDLWFMEGTATWVEDEVFPAINDNVQYLAYSPIRYPRSSADYTSGLHRYGAWIMFRFAAEYFRDRNVVRQMWEAADSGRGSAYSLQAIRSVVSARTAWETFFNRFASWNTLHGGSYRERARYPTPTYLRLQTLSATSPSTGNLTAVLRHLASASVKIVPATNLPTTKQLVVEVDAPDTSSGSTALLQVRFRSGSTSLLAIPLDAAGNGARTTGFDRTRISSAVVVLANTSTAMTDCGEIIDYDGPLYSCAGRGVLDAQRFQVRVQVL